MEKAAALCLRIGCLMLESGAETARVEETLAHVGIALGMPTESMVTPTGITVSVAGDRVVTRIRRITGRAVDLDRVAVLNGISRRLGAGELDLEQAWREVDEAEQRPCQYGTALRWLAAGAGSASFAALLGGGAAETGLAFGLGMGLKLLMSLLEPSFPGFLALFFGSLASTAAAFSAAAALGRLHLEALVLGAVTPLLPGLSLTNAVRDLMAGDLVSGVARSAEALLAATALACGVLAALTLSRGWSA
ncbi:MAG TPA: threonine/serine exporter family protein [Candidatus Nitrosotenuis sp.]|nr:threonine/serine exporter family protein [Candidatus Nitrosotenuis sp.]